MIDRLRQPFLAFSFAIDRLRRLPDALPLAPVAPVFHWLSSSELALRMLASSDVMTIGFASRRDRDAAFATLFAGAQPRSFADIRRLAASC